jgi:hypothetical protein
MDRKRKRAIHLKITQLLDEHCTSCDFRGKNKSHSHCKHNCPIGKEFAIYSSMLEGTGNDHFAVPEDSLNTGRWTKEEEIYLINHANIFKVDHLAKTLNRSHGSVWNKLTRLKKAKILSMPKKRKVNEDGLSG